MDRGEKKTYGRFSLFCYGEPIEPPKLINELYAVHNIERKGRGGIKKLRIDNRLLACRKYIHGGLFRTITRDIFFTKTRGINEIEILLYLKDKGFHVVTPYCLLTKNKLLSKRLYLFTLYEEHTTEFLEYLKISTARDHMRMIRKFAHLLWNLETLGIYHPDLHLNNVLINNEKDIIFLDFDNAYRKSITKKDMEKMFWRLNRFIDKMERRGDLKVGTREKILFLRTYKRLSGYDMAQAMAKKVKTKRYLSEIGWVVERALYGE